MTGNQWSQQKVSTMEIYVIEVQERDELIAQRLTCTVSELKPKNDDRQGLVEGTIVKLVKNMFSRSRNPMKLQTNNIPSNILC